MGLFDVFKQTGVEIVENEDGTVNIYPKGEDHVVFGFRSESEEYAAGRVDGIVNLDGKKEPGEAILTRKGGILWRKDFEKPRDCSVSNTGRVVVTNGRKLHVFDRDGSEIFFKEFDVPEFRLSDWEEKNLDDSEVEAQKSRWAGYAGRLENCAISPNGNKIVVVANSQPRMPLPRRCELFVYDLISNKELLRRETPSNKGVYLEINDEVISVIIKKLGVHVEDNPDFIIDLETGNTVGGERKRDLDRVKDIYGKKK